MKIGSIRPAELHRRLMIVVVELEIKAYLSRSRAIESSINSTLYGIASAAPDAVQSQSLTDYPTPRGSL